MSSQITNQINRMRIWQLGSVIFLTSQKKGCDIIIWLGDALIYNNYLKWWSHFSNHHRNFFWLCWKYNSGFSSKLHYQFFYHQTILAVAKLSTVLSFIYLFDYLGKVKLVILEPTFHPCIARRMSSQVT